MKKFNQIKNSQRTKSQTPRDNINSDINNNQDHTTSAEILHDPSEEVRIVFTKLRSISNKFDHFEKNKYNFPIMPIIFILLDVSLLLVLTGLILHGIMTNNPFFSINYPLAILILFSFYSIANEAEEIGLFIDNDIGWYVNSLLTCSIIPIFSLFTIRSQIIKVIEHHKKMKIANLIMKISDSELKKKIGDCKIHLLFAIPSSNSTVSNLKKREEYLYHIDNILLLLRDNHGVKRENISLLASWAEDIEIVRKIIYEWPSTCSIYSTLGFRELKQLTIEHMNDGYNEYRY